MVDNLIRILVLILLTLWILIGYKLFVIIRRIEQLIHNSGKISQVVHKNPPS